jgi:hypothetical protein
VKRASASCTQRNSAADHRGRRRAPVGGLRFPAC